MRPNIHCHLINGPFGDPAVYADVMFEQRALLFDLGDLSTLAPRKLLRVTHVFVSHAHMDHFAGFDHLLRLLLGREKLVRLYGPAGFIDKVEHKLRAYTWNVIHNYIGNLVFEAGEVSDDLSLRRARFQSFSAFERESMPEQRLEGDVLTCCGALVVRFAILDHGTPCLAFAVQEPAHFNVWKTKLEERGLLVGPWLRDLKRAIQEDQLDSFPIQALRHSDQGDVSVSLPLHALREVVQVTSGQKIAYVVDVRYHDANAERIERLAFGADLLFIETAFLEADTAHAARKNHLTARQAGLLARRAQVKRLVPFHFSMRYSDRANALSEEAQRAFLFPTAGMGPDEPAALNAGRGEGAMVQPIPENYPTLTPYMIMTDGNAAVSFYERAFGARVRLRIGEPGGVVRHAELEIGKSLIMIADEHPEMGALGPRAHGGSPVSLYLYVEDVDAVLDRAVSAGATLGAAAETKFYGDRTGRIIDPFGYAWHIATHVEDVSEEEIRRRAETAMA